MKLRGSKHLKVTNTGIAIWASNGEIKVGDTVEKKDRDGGIYKAVVKKAEYPSTSRQYSLGSITLYGGSTHYSNDYTIVNEVS